MKHTITSSLWYSICWIYHVQCRFNILLVDSANQKFKRSCFCSSFSLTQRGSSLLSSILLVFLSLTMESWNVPMVLCQAQDLQPTAAGCALELFLQEPPESFHRVWSKMNCLYLAKKAYTLIVMYQDIILSKKLTRLE